MEGIALRVRLAGLAVLALSLAVGVDLAHAGGGASLSLQVYPGSLVAGGSGAVKATFANTGSSTLTHVIVNVTLPDGVTFDSGGSSPTCAGTAPTIACSLGSVAKGATVAATVAFGNVPDSGPITFGGSATWDAASVGAPHGAAAQGTTTGSASADVISLGDLLGAASSCLPGGDTLDVPVEGGQEINVSAGDNTLGLSCTPMIAGIDDGNVFFTKLPSLVTPAHVILTFTDENLPWPDGGTPRPENRDLEVPNQLNEYPNYPKTETTVTVPWCDPGPALPANPGGGGSTDSCIVAITSTDESDDNDFDADMGTVELLVQGSASGDPGYPGG